MKRKLPPELSIQNSHVQYPHTRTYYSDSLKMYFVVGHMNGIDIYAQHAFYADRATGLARKISWKIDKLIAKNPPAKKK